VRSHGRRVKLRLAVCAGGSIPREFGVCGSPLAAWRLCCILASASEGVEDLALHPQQPGLDRGGLAKTPEHGRDPVNELLLNRRFRQVLIYNRVLESPNGRPDVWQGGPIDPNPSENQDSYCQVKRINEF
jgi:hypothetical protein